MVDIADLKSADREVVRVRIPLPAPLISYSFYLKVEDCAMVDILICVGFAAVLIGKWHYFNKRYK